VSHGATIRSRKSPPIGTWRTQGELIEALGNLCRRVGLPRSLGQIYGLLLFSERPLSLDEIAERLGVSKASASVGSRQLAGWGALRTVWVPGDRRDYFEVEADILGVLRKAYVEWFKPRLGRTRQRFETLQSSLARDLAEGVITQEQFECCAGRLKHLQGLQRKLQLTSPIVDGLLL
jgi:DNA-binding transcriptional regulator GbsR (MarR family)